MFLGRAKDYHGKGNLDDDFQILRKNFEQTYAPNIHGGSAIDLNSSLNLLTTWGGDFRTSMETKALELEVL